jgi:hypothetical protein
LILTVCFFQYREFRKEQVRVNAMLRRAAVERDAEQARLAYLQRMHEIEVRADIFLCICAVEVVALCCRVALCQAGDVQAVTAFEYAAVKPRVQRILLILYLDW